MEEKAAKTSTEERCIVIVENATEIEGGKGTRQRA